MGRLSTSAVASAVVLTAAAGACRRAEAPRLGMERTIASPSAPGPSPTPASDCPRPRACAPIIHEQLPTVRARVQPAYPESARINRIEGETDVWAWVDHTGTVVAACVASGPNELRAAARDAVAAWRFSAVGPPGSCVLARVTVRFSLAPVHSP